MSLFPMIQPEVQKTEQKLSMYREVMWDFQKNIPIYKNGSPTIIEGKEAVVVWAWKALHAQRFRYEMYSWEYGNETESLIGQNFSEELKRAEAARYVRECLLINPYITDAADVSVEFSDGLLAITGTLITIYGEAKLNV
ncbi:DUF2634 domain-containing protein [Caproiciproducens sp.]|uniref:DUF2634 domain-containing protein n=1 Tax=Caproiciproducens sp. TaxID=1954376 RepID=UPI0028A248AE|nr:DUF2634 domain-containing protein [Caproiciproducens sp.]